MQINTNNDQECPLDRPYLGRVNLDEGCYIDANFLPGKTQTPGIYVWTFQSDQIIINSNSDPIVTSVKVNTKSIIRPVYIDNGSSQFFSQECYLVLHSKKLQQVHLNEPYKMSNTLRHDVYVWVSPDYLKEESKDKYTIACYNAIRINHILGSEPNQYYQVHNQESLAFLELFAQQGGLRVLKGQFSSRFLPETPNSNFGSAGQSNFGSATISNAPITSKPYTPRLLKIIPNSLTVINEVEACVKSLNTRDGFIYDRGDLLVIWIHPSSQFKSSPKLDEIIVSMDMERNGKPSIVKINDKSDPKLFWEPLGGNFNSQIREAISGQITTQTNRLITDIKIYRIDCNFNNTDIYFTLRPYGVTKHGKIPVSLLDPGSCMIIDLISSNSKDLLSANIYLHVGSQDNTKYEYPHLDLILKYLRTNNKSLSLPLAIVYQGYAPKEFSELFE